MALENFMNSNIVDPNMLGLGMLAGVSVGIIVAIGVLFYVYFALALATIGKKLNVGKTWMAWIPVVNLFYIPMLAGYEWYYGFLWILAFIPMIGWTVISLILLIWWFWKIAEKRNFPGWFAIFLFVPSISILIPGIIAWYENKKK